MNLIRSQGVAWRRTMHCLVPCKEGMTLSVKWQVGYLELSDLKNQLLHPAHDSVAVADSKNCNNCRRRSHYHINCDGVTFEHAHNLDSVPLGSFSRHLKSSKHELDARRKHIESNMWRRRKGTNEDLQTCDTEIFVTDCKLGLQLLSLFLCGPNESSH